MKTEDCIRQILQNLGEDPSREDLKETPNRVAKMYEEIFSGYQTNPDNVIKTFDNEGYDEMILVRDIEYYSTCEHHMVPFFGKAHIAYIPDKKITGLSKLARLTDVFARRLQNQERLTVQIARTIFENLHPKGVGVMITGKHLCMCSRGVKKPDSETITSAFFGNFKEQPGLRSDFLVQINH